MRLVSSRLKRGGAQNQTTMPLHLRSSITCPQRSCERIVLGKGAKVLIRESAQGSCLPTWKKKVKTRRMKRKMREKMESKE